MVVIIKKRAPKKTGAAGGSESSERAFQKTGADPGPQSSIAWPVAFFSMDDPDSVIPYSLIEYLSNPVRTP